MHNVWPYPLRRSHIAEFTAPRGELGVVPQPIRYTSEDADQDGCARWCQRVAADSGNRFLAEAVRRAGASAKFALVATP